MDGRVVFDGVWKEFARGERHDSLRDLIPAAFKRLFRGRTHADERAANRFWAVRDVSFEVRPGEAVRIGAASYILSLEDIPTALERLVMVK